MSSPESSVIEVAKAAADAWLRETWSDAEDAVGLGVVAALSLLGRRNPEGPEPAERILAASDEEIAQMLEETWCLFTIIRPELAFRCGPFGRWLGEEPRSTAHVAGAAAVARTVVKAGLLEFTLDRAAAQKVDVLGHLYLLLRNDKAKRKHGEFYTPGPVAEAMARMALEVAEPEKSITDEFAGTGGLLRASAETLRRTGKNPHEFWWYGCDIDPVVVAGLAVNVHVWDLGPRVVIGCANVLAEPDWVVRAAEEQKAAIETQETTASVATLIDTLNAIEECWSKGVPGDGATAEAGITEARRGGRDLRGRAGGCR